MSRTTALQRQTNRGFISVKLMSWSVSTLYSNNGVLRTAHTSCVKSLDAGTAPSTFLRNLKHSATLYYHGARFDTFEVQMLLAIYRKTKYGDDSDSNFKARSKLLQQ